MEIVCPAWFPEMDELTAAIPSLADQGVTAIEVMLTTPGYFARGNSRELDALQHRLRASGIRANSIHMPFGPKCDISSLDDELHECGVDALIESIEFAGVVDARTVIVHASDKLNGPPNGRLERARGVLREMSLVAKESGIVLALENLPPDYLGHTPEEVFALLNGTDPEWMSVCFDSGHANLSGRFQEFAEELLPRSVATHLHDNNGTKDDHRFPGDGSIDWRQFSCTLRQSGARASVTLECKPPHQLPWREAFQRLRLALDQ